MKKMKLFHTFICFICVVSCFLPCVYATTVDDTTNKTDITDSSTSQVYGCHGIDATVSLLGSDKLVENISSAFLYELKSDSLMYASNADERVSPSSLVKILTALIAVERGDPKAMVTVREDVLQTVPADAVLADLLPGEVISLENLINCMLVGSANDAAAVIADHVSGSQSEFVTLMNAYADALGCNDTNFVNVHGLHDDQQYTTARDMARILTAAMKNELFRSYFSTVHCTIPATNKSEERDLLTGNFLMNTEDMEIYYDERVTGGRTGITEAGTRCLAVSAQYNDMELICIVMGAESVFAEDGYTVAVFGGYKEVSELLNVGFDGFQTSQVLYKEQILKQSNVLNGANDVVLGVKDESFAVLPAGTTMDSLNVKCVEVMPIEAPVNKGDVLMRAQVWNGNICVAETDLIAMNSVSELTTQVEQPVSDAGNTKNGSILWTIFGIVLAIGAVFAVVLFILRFRGLLALRREKKYRKARRRSR